MSSTLDQLLNKGRSSLPPSVGQAYDTATGIGSWITAGMEGYKSALAEWNSLKRYLKRLGNIKNDPQALFYTINALLRENPVKIPPYMSGDDFNMIRKLLKSILGGGGADGPYTLRDYKSTALAPNETKNEDKNRYGTVVQLPSQRKVVSNEENYLPLFKIKDSNEQYFDGTGEFDTYYNRVVRDYTEITTPYLTSQKVTSPAEAVKYAIEQLGASIGYQSWGGFEIGSDHQWDIQIRPYHPTGDPNAKDTFTPELPSYRLPRLITEDDIEVAEFSFGDHCPCISYNLQYGNQATRDINLYNGSKVQFPTGFSYDMLLSIDIVDDVYRSFHKYMNKYLNAIYDLENNAVAPYHQAAFEITLLVFRPGYNVNFMFKFVACPVNYTPVLEGQNDPSEARVHIDFSVIGIVNPSQASSNPIIANGNTDWENNTMWSDVILNQSGGIAK